MLRSLGTYLPSILQVAGAALIAAPSLPFIDHGWWDPWLFWGGIAVAVLGGVWALLEDARRRSLLTQNLTMRAELDALGSPNAEIATFVLQRLLRQMSIDEPDFRASLFVRGHDGEDHLAGRYSRNAELRTPGRSTYPPNQGAVADAWRLEVFHIDNLPKNRSQWNKKMSSVFNLDPEHAAALRMQSRSYACTRVHQSEGAVDRPVGVLLIESLQPFGIVPDHVDQLRNSPDLRLMGSLCTGFQRREDALATAG